MKGPFLLSCALLAASAVSAQAGPGFSQSFRKSFIYIASFQAFPGKDLRGAHHVKLPNNPPGQWTCAVTVHDLQFFGGSTRGVARSVDPHGSCRSLITGSAGGAARRTVYARGQSAYNAGAPSQGVAEMLKPLAPVSLAACALFLPAADLSAQCATFGTPCSHALLCSNSAPPKIGQIWRIGIQAACGNPSNNFMIFGPCASPGLVIPPPLACSSCALQTFPDVFVLPWSWPPRELSVPIPNDVRLVGGTFCVQNICSNGGPCLTFSDPMQVTVLP